MSAETNKPNLDNAEQPKSWAEKTMEGLSKNMSDSLAKMRELATGESQSDRVRLNAGNPDYANMAIAATKESHDDGTLTTYMEAMKPEEVTKLPKETQLALLDAANHTYGNSSDLNSTISGYKNFDDSGRLYESLSRLPAAQKQMLQQYTDGLNNGLYKNKLPGLIRGLPAENQKIIYDLNPKLFAEHFPDSKFVEGTVLNDLVTREIEDLPYTTALDLSKHSFLGREYSLLKNPHLSKKQLNGIATAFLEIKYDARRENENFMEATENIIKTIDLLKGKGCFDGNLSDKYEKKFGKGIFDLYPKMKQEEETRAYWTQHESH